jgi:hypothetical protein
VLTHAARVASQLVELANQCTCRDGSERRRARFLPNSFWLTLKAFTNAARCLSPRDTRHRSHTFKVWSRSSRTQGYWRCTSLEIVAGQPKGPALLCGNAAAQIWHGPMALQRGNDLTATERDEIRDAMRFANLLNRSSADGWPGQRGAPDVSAASCPRSPVALERPCCRGCPRPIRQAARPPLAARKLPSPTAASLAATKMVDRVGKCPVQIHWHAQRHEGEIHVVRRDHQFVFAICTFSATMCVAMPQRTTSGPSMRICRPMTALIGCCDAQASTSPP